MIIIIIIIIIIITVIIIVGRNLPRLEPRGGSLRFIGMFQGCEVYMCVSESYALK